VETTVKVQVLFQRHLPDQLGAPPYYAITNFLVLSFQCSFMSAVFFLLLIQYGGVSTGGGNPEEGLSSVNAALHLRI